MHVRTKFRRGFTLIELLVVIAIIAILSVVVILVLNPSELLKQSRDSNRISDLSTMNDALGIFSEDVVASLGNASTTYISIPDPVATSTVGDQCQGLGLPSLPQGGTYHCASSSTVKNVDGTGWIPTNLQAISFRAPISNLGLDPLNTSSSRFYYSYTTNGTQYELTSNFESQKYIPQMTTDGGSYDGVYQVGTKLDLNPPIRSYGLLGYWPMDEGSGSTASDQSGNGNGLTWGGSQSSPSSTYYVAGKVGTAGYFNGSNDKASVGSISAFNNFGTGDFSIAFWINPQGSWSATTQGIIGQKTNDTAPGFQIYHDSGDSTQIRLRMGDAAGNGGDVKSTVGSVSTGQWTFIVAMRQSGIGYIYVNGVQNSSTANNKNISGGSASFNIGYADTWGAYYTGYLDDVRVYSRALSAAEIAAIYNAER
jgi:prepilin-type N-terminal cleavage/methylation domain-containing protein